MTKAFVLVNNGGCYSDYGIEGIVICNKKDKPKVAAIIEEAQKEYNRLYSEASSWQRERREDVIIKFPVKSTIISQFCDKNNMKYIHDLGEVSFDY